MPTVSPNASGSSSLYFGGLLAVTSLVLVGGGAIIWSHREPMKPTAHIAPSADESPARPPARSVPPAPVPVDGERGGVHSISYAVENGTPVVKIKVVPGGDELIVDAATGRLLETRPGRPTAPPPMGKFAAPFLPVM